MTTLQNKILQHFTSNPSYTTYTTRSLERTFNFIYSPAQIRVALNQLSKSNQITKYADYRPVRFKLPHQQ